MARSCIVPNYAKVSLVARSRIASRFAGILACGDRMKLAMTVASEIPLSRSASTSDASFCGLCAPSRTIFLAHGMTLAVACKREQ